MTVSCIFNDDDNAGDDDKIMLMMVIFNANSTPHNIGLFNFLFVDVFFIAT